MLLQVINRSLERKSIAAHLKVIRKKLNAILTGEKNLTCKMLQINLLNLSLPKINQTTREWGK